MPCDTISQEEMVKRKRERQIKKLEKELKAKTAKITKVGNTINIEGWSERGGWCDACAIRRLKQSADFEIRNLLARAVPTEQGIKFGHGH